MRGELDWIVMKALEKDRNRRYETANGFAADVQRYLADEPVQACPPSVGYPAAEVPAAEQGPVLAAPSSGAGRRHHRHDRRAGGCRTAQRTEAVRADGESEAKHAAQARGGNRGCARFRRTEGLCRSAEAMPGGLGYDVTLRRAMEAALPLVDASFSDRPLIEARFRLTLGDSFLQLGETKAAAAKWEACRLLYTKHRGVDHPDTLKILDRLGNCYVRLGRHRSGRAAFRRRWHCGRQNSAWSIRIR